jgi:hypothetical protein
MVKVLIEKGALLEPHYSGDPHPRSPIFLAAKMTDVTSQDKFLEKRK